jgi:putative adhesin
MQKILFLLLSGLPMLAIQAQSNSDQKDLFQVKTLAGASFQQADVETNGGNISFYGVAATDARVEVYITDNNGHNITLSKEEIQKRLDEMYDLNIGVSNNKLTAIAKHKEGVRYTENRKELSISFKVFVPQSVSSTLRTSGGNIDLGNLAGGTQDFKTSGGNLAIDHVSGKLKGRTSGGNISLKDVKDDVEMSTSGGNVVAGDCQGNIRLTTSGGNMVLQNLKGDIWANTSGGNVQGEMVGGDLHTSTSGGDIRLKDLSCSLTASNSGGSIDVRMTTMGQYLNLKNSGGDIRLELPQGKGMDLSLYGDPVVRATTLGNFAGDVDEKHISGKLNGGGIPVKVDGNGGRVSLSFK